MKNGFPILLAILATLGVSTFTTSSHPGSGIVVDAQGRVYFSEAGDIDAHLPGAVWQIDRQGKLTRLHEGGAHWLTLDVKRGCSRLIFLSESPPADRPVFESSVLVPHTGC